MSDQVYSAVVVGCGRIGSLFSEQTRSPGNHSHAQAYVENTRTRLVGLSDSNRERLKGAADHWGIAETSTDPLEVCRKLQPEIVSVCTPDSTHFETARSILESCPPRLLFIEKPVALRSADAEALLALAREKNCAISINYSRRFSPAVRALKKELASGAHGRPVFAHVLYGKGLVHNGTHALDLLRFWLGDPVSARGKPVATASPHEFESWEVDWEFSDGCRARFDVLDDQEATVFELDFLTTKSRWRFWLGGSSWEFSEIRENPEYAGYRNFVPSGRERTDPLFEKPMAANLRLAVQNLVDHLDGSAPLLCDGGDGLRSLEWVERILQGSA
ncbi:MAG: Gfo/Idh/MocA family oxidoreductase [Bdellovibrionota bacterium]